MVGYGQATVAVNVRNEDLIEARCEGEHPQNHEDGPIARALPWPVARRILLLNKASIRPLRGREHFQNIFHV